MSRLPVEPAVASVLLQSRSTDKRTINAAMAAIWESGGKKQPESNDLFEMAMAFMKDGKGRGWGSEVRETFEQLERLLKDDEAGMVPCTKNQNGLRKETARVWMRTFSHRIAVRSGETSLYEFPDKRCARLAVKSEQGGPQQLPRIILALAVREQAGRQQSKKTTIPLYMPLEAEWIAEMFPNELRRGVECKWDEVRKRVIVEEIVCFRGASIERREPENKAPYDGKVAACLSEQLCRGAWEWQKEDPKAEQYVYRVKQVSSAYPEMKLPQMTSSDWELIYTEISEGKSSLAETRKSSIIQAVKAYIGGNNAAFVERKAPEIVILPSGKKGRITYFDGAPPELSARLGDLIGHRERFVLMDCRVHGVFNILAPNYRTVQKTSDLASFWKNVYPSIKSELRRKYPKHPWP
jgi:HrpA-like RNA helicase